MRDIFLFIRKYQRRPPDWSRLIWHIIDVETSNSNHELNLNLNAFRRDFESRCRDGATNNNKKKMFVNLRFVRDTMINMGTLSEKAKKVMEEHFVW